MSRFPRDRKAAEQVGRKCSVSRWYWGHWPGWVVGQERASAWGQEPGLWSWASCVWSLASSLRDVWPWVSNLICVPQFPLLWNGLLVTHSQNPFEGHVPWHSLCSWWRPAAVCSVCSSRRLPPSSLSDPNRSSWHLEVQPWLPLPLPLGVPGFYFGRQGIWPNIAALSWKSPIIATCLPSVLVGVLNRPVAWRQQECSACVAIWSFLLT